MNATARVANVRPSKRKRDFVYDTDVAFYIAMGVFFPTAFFCTLTRYARGHTRKFTRGREIHGDPVSFGDLLHVVGHAVHVRYLVRFFRTTVVLGLLHSFHFFTNRFSTVTVPR